MLSSIINAQLAISSAQLWSRIFLTRRTPPALKIPSYYFKYAACDVASVSEPNYTIISDFWLGL